MSFTYFLQKNYYKLKNELITQLTNKEIDCNEHEGLTTLINKIQYLASQMKDMTGRVVWNDNNSGSRPNYVSMLAVNEDKVIAQATVNASNSWTYIFEDVPLSAYVVCNISDLAGDYNQTVTGGEDDTYVCTLTELKGTLRIQCDFYIEGYGRMDCEVDEGYDPMSNIWNISFEILGDDARVPMTIQYSQFVNEAFELSGVSVGDYVIHCFNADKRVCAKLTSSSITTQYLTIENGGTATASFYLNYEGIYRNESQEEEPEDGLIDIPVSITWNDNDDSDGNRPSSVAVTLHSGGNVISTQTLTAPEWSYVWTDLPETMNGAVVRYTVSEGVVEYYASSTNGYTITNTYQRQLTSQTVRIVWDDDENSEGLRPSSLTCTLLQNGNQKGTYILNESNDWIVTASNLSRYVNKSEASYTWSYIEPAGYRIQNQSVSEGVTTFTFTLEQTDAPENPETPKVPGEDWGVFEDYETPL